MGSRGSETENRAELKSDSKILGEKRTGGESEGDELHSSQKRLKIRDLKSVCRSDEFSSEYHESSKNKRNAELHVHENDESRADKVREKTPDLNTDARVVRGDKVLDDDRDECSKSDSDFGASRCPGLELNSEDVSSSMRMMMMMTNSRQDPFFPYKNLNHAKSSRDVISECASSTGPLEESDPLKVWNEMKQNGFLSASHGGIPIPKQRGRKAKTDVLKKKMEIAKKEQVDRFTRIAAPSGLLNELNPGIINHVRNRKQVHSIIKALVRSEKHENSQAGTKPTGISDEERQADTASWVRQSSEFSASLVRCPSTIAEGKRVESEQVVLPVEERLALKPGTSQSTVVHGEEGLALKLSSSTKLLENEGSSELHLSIKAATVASQWLELLSQDVKGRLAALRRSKKRLRAVISTELPFLLSKEFPSDEENNPFSARNSASAFSHFAAAEMHRARWNKLFDQMDESLSEEERQLESWLVQVKEMQIHCEHGLHQAHSNPLLGLGPSSDLRSSDLRWGLHSDRAMAVRASAASIYSTCNFILTHSNVSCF